MRPSARICELRARTLPLSPIGEPPAEAAGIGMARSRSACRMSRDRQITVRALTSRHADSCTPSPVRFAGVWVETGPVMTGPLCQRSDASPLIHSTDTVSGSNPRPCRADPDPTNATQARSTSCAVEVGSARMSTTLPGLTGPYTPSGRASRSPTARPWLMPGLWARSHLRDGGPESDAEIGARAPVTGSTSMKAQCFSVVVAAAWPSYWCRSRSTPT
jgi:hypothetical protein